MNLNKVLLECDNEDVELLLSFIAARMHERPYMERCRSLLDRLHVLQRVFDCCEDVANVVGD